MFDASTQDDSRAIDINIFRPLAEMPDVSAGDVVMLTQAKVPRYAWLFEGTQLTHVQVQNYRGMVSLITNFQTALHVYDASKMPKPPESAKPALKSRKGKVRGRSPVDKEHEYVSYVYHNVDKYDVPDLEEFQQRSAASIGGRQKFSLLKDARDGIFISFIGRLAKDPYDEGDKLTLWVSDYTENQAFFRHTFEGVQSLRNDPYGYTSHENNTATQKWVGPFGKRSIQITCYEPHAGYLRDEQVGAGQWLFLRNVQIKLGHNGANLEGKLREDRGAMAGRINVEILDTLGQDGDKDSIDPRFKDAVRRWRAYEKVKKAELRSIQKAQEVGAQRRAQVGEPKAAGKKKRPDLDVSHAGDGKKRRRDILEDENPTPQHSDSDRGSEANTTSPRPKKSNSKKRRKALRAELARKEKEEQEHIEEMLGLNQNIKCENVCRGPTRVATMQETSFYEATNQQGQKIRLALPFHNRKYIANVRVVDFIPGKLEDFAKSRRVTEYDNILSDSSDSSASASSASNPDDSDSHDAPAGKLRWEWRFMLQLEDALPVPRAKGAAAQRIWVVVDDLEAQCLTDLDASDLRADPDKLATLRERLFTLWGDLEEHKARQQQDRDAAAEERRQPGRVPARSVLGHRGRADEPPPSSDDRAGTPPARAVSNKPFACCIKQYGKRVREADAEKMDAGEGYRWQRLYMMFGTKINIE